MFRRWFHDFGPNSTHRHLHLKRSLFLLHTVLQSLSNEFLLNGIYLEYQKEQLHHIPPAEIFRLDSAAVKAGSGHHLPRDHHPHHLIVVEKKEGLLSVATDHQKEKTAQHILSEYVKRQHRNNRVFVVHRLDRETSGIMMYAKDEKTQHTLRDNWHDIVRDRRYVSIVMGDMEKDQGTVESWLTDRKLYVSSSPVDDGGKYSVTHYRTIKRANGYSLVELQLETGRKNQIRVHMQSLGHPVVGDERYGCEVNPLGRLALHAFKLCFYHPVTGELMEFETPYPTPFKNLMLRK